MRKLTANTFVTADGVMQAPGGPDEDRSGGFSYGGWIAEYWDDMMQKILSAWMSRPFDLLLGRKTYEIFAAHWPRVTNDPTADGFNKATKYVASRTLKQLEWQPAQLLGPDVPEAIAELKRGDGRELQLHGSGDLLQTLFRHKLVDEIRIWTFPIVLGTGKRLFRNGSAPGGLQLIESAVSASGVQVGNYKTGAPIHLKSLALEPNKQELDRRAKVAREG
jgi:dihydrofolate reductase